MGFREERSKKRKLPAALAVSANGQLRRPFKGEQASCRRTPETP